MLESERLWGALARPLHKSTQARARAPFPKRVTDHSSVRTLHKGRRGTPTAALFGSLHGALTSSRRAPFEELLPSSLERGVPPSFFPLFMVPHSARVTERDGSDHAEAPAIIYLSQLPDRA